MISASKIKGKIKYTLFDEQMNIKQVGEVENVVTTQGNSYYVDRLTAQDGIEANMFVLGTGTANVATTDTWVAGYYADNGTLAGTAGSVTVGRNSGTLNAIQYSGTFMPGYATQNGITRVGLTNMVASADGNGTPTGTSTYFIAHGTIDPTVNKSASDTLVITWNHLFEGS